MFLPKYINQFFEVATFKNSDKKLVKKSNLLYKKKEVKKQHDFFTSPLFIFGILSFIILFITYSDFKKNKQTRWLDTVLFITTGLIGIIILLLWFATDHTGTHQNYNLLWACVLNIFVIRQVFKKKASAWF